MINSNDANANDRDLAEAVLQYYLCGAEYRPQLPSGLQHTLYDSIRFNEVQKDRVSLTFYYFI